MATKMFDAKVSRKTKAAQTEIAGYYTQRVAAERLGVDSATLAYRRDSADAKAFWKGKVQDDKILAFLHDSHKIVKGRHYFKIDLFDTFADLWVQRPEVIRARAAQTTFITNKKIEPIMERTIETVKDRQLLADQLGILNSTDGKLKVLVFIEKA